MCMGVLVELHGGEGCALELGLGGRMAIPPHRVLGTVHA